MGDRDEDGVGRAEGEASPQPGDPAGLPAQESHRRQGQVTAQVLKQSEGAPRKYLVIDTKQQRLQCPNIVSIDIKYYQATDSQQKKF